MKQSYEEGDYAKVNWQGSRLEGKIIAVLIENPSYYWVFCPRYNYPTKTIVVNREEITRKMNRTEIVFFKLLGCVLNEKLTS